MPDVRSNSNTHGKSNSFLKISKANHISIWVRNVKKRNLEINKIQYTRCAQGSPPQNHDVIEPGESPYTQQLLPEGTELGSNKGEGLLTSAYPFGLATKCSSVLSYFSYDVRFITYSTCI